MNLHFQNVVSEYKEDLPNHEITDQEIHPWLGQNEKIRQSTLATSLKECKKKIVFRICMSY